VTAAVVVVVVAVAIVVAALWYQRTRARARRRERVADLVAAVDPAAPSTQAVKDEIAAAVARLPDPEKLVVSLTYLEGMADGDIGEVLGIDGPTVARIREQGVRRLSGLYRRRPGVDE
jgi:DNA-directed RNA polymerase specialized sigma24 family protein